jgi:hypothetical protein
MANQNECGKCQFWLQTGATDDGLVGECHRKPPSPRLFEPPAGSKMVFAVWPSTMEGQWCGAFEERAMDNTELLERMAVIEQMEKQRKQRS